MKPVLAVLTLLGGLAFAAAAHADTFDVTFSANSGSISGTAVITATSNGPNSFLASSVTGPGIGPIIAAGDINGNDNLIFPTSASLFDASGLGFYYNDAGTILDVDVYASGGGYVAFYNDNGTLGSDPINVSLVPATAVTPEPSSLILLSTGLLGAVGVLRRRLLLV